MITIDANQLDHQLSSFVMVLVRISTLLMTDVMMGSKWVPTRYRLLLALSLSGAIFPLLPLPTPFTLFSLLGIMMITQQIIIGLLMATIFQFIFQIMLYGGQLIAYQIGLGFAKLTDPSAHVSIGIMSQVYTLAAIMLFLSLNGHLMIIRLMVNSFDTIPLSTTHLFDFNFLELSQFASMIFMGGLSIALPSVIALLIINTTFAIMSRSAPQMNILSIGFPITLIMGFVIIYLTFPGTMNRCHTYFEAGFTFIQHALGIV